MSTIKFYSNYKDGKVFISGQNEKKVWLSLWKSTDFNKDMYLDNDKFKGGLEIDKSVLKLHDDKPGCRVLVFKDSEEEAKYCITKEEVEKRKKARQTKATTKNVFDYIDDIVREFFESVFVEVKGEDYGLSCDELDAPIIHKILNTTQEELEEIKEDEPQDDLPF